MLERTSIKNTFILSAIFETREDIEKNPFDFLPDKIKEQSPDQVEGCLRRGYMIRLQVSLKI